MSYAIAETSISHTYGNVTSFMVEYIKGLFPKNYFKTVHVHSTIAYRNFDVLKNTKKDFFKKSKPILIITPKVDMDTNDLYLGGTYLTKRITDNVMDLDFGNLQPFIEDNDKGIHVKYLLNRLKMNFDVSIVVETQMEQIDISHGLKNRVTMEQPLTLTTALESYVAKDVMELISKDSGIPLYDENNSVGPFLEYVNSKSYYPISYKMKNSRGKDEFFRFYNVNIDALISGLSIDEGSKRGFIDDSYTITFSVSAEFNGTGLYYYFTRNEKTIDGVDMSMISSDNPDQIIPLFTISNLHALRVGDGWSLYSSPIYGVEETDKYDELDISTILNHSLLKVIEYHKINSIPFELFIKTVVMKDNALLTYGRDYEIDFDRMVLITKRINTFSTYRLIIYVNTLYINTLLQNIFSLNEEK